MTKEDSSGEEPGSRFSGQKRCDLFLSEYLANSNEERQDVIFRRVRGILNKITPETFDKLSKDLVNVGLDSPRTLRGLIYLLFDKALKDLKYSSLYAKLCQKLSEKSPNFEKEPGPNTFCKFLISKCEDEFERRRKATEDFERKNELTDEEFEQKVIAKQKMLGNIKFICELGKKRLLQEEILHECIRGLLSRKKERTLQDQAQDLECLCQIMRTIGSLLDVETSKNLMNQYFERIDMYSRKQELPSRIRFMLRDVIDLRNNNWRPRPFQREDNVPQPLSKLREEASFSNAASSAPIDKLGNTKNLMNINKLNAKDISKLLDDEPGFTTTTDFHWGASPFLPHENEYDIFSVNSYTQPKTQAVNPIKATTTNAATLQTNAPTISSNSNSNFHASNNSLAPRFLQASRFDAFAGQNHFDTFVRAPQFANNTRSNHDTELTSLNLKDSLQNMRNENLGTRYNANRRFDKRSSAREGPVTSQSHLPFARLSPTSNLDINELDVSAAISQPKEEHFRCNNTSRINASSNRDLNHQQLHQSQYRPPPRHLNLHGDDESYQSESSKPLPSSRNNDKLVASRNVSAPRDHNTDESLSQNSLPPHNRSQPSRGSNQKQQVNQLNQKHNPGAVVNGGSRSRRFERGHEYEPRQPKFSGANYRLPGRERPQPQTMNRNLQPESELNMNWRSPESARATNIPSVDDKGERQQLTKPNTSRQISDSSESSKQRIPGNEPLDEHRTDLEEVRDLNNLDSDINRKNFMNRVDRHTSVMKSRSSLHGEHFATDPISDMIPPSHLRFPTRGYPSGPKHFLGWDHPPPRFMNNNTNNNNNNNNLSHNNNGTSDHKSGETDTIQVHRSRRNHHDDLDFRSGRQNGPSNHQPTPSNANHREGPQARTNSVEKHELKRLDDHQRRQLAFSPIQHSGPFRQENDHKHQNSRLNETQTNHDRRSYRPAPMGRNQSFEGHNVLDSKRSSNRRTEDLNSANNPSSKKDATPIPPSIISAHHQVLTRLPIPMSAADFSLRPSHNLVGRPVVEAKTVEKNDEQNQDKTVSNQSETKTSERLPAEDSTRQIQEVKEWLESLDGSKEPKTPTRGQIANASQYVGKFTTLFARYLNEASSDVSKVYSNFRDMKLPRELHETCLVHAMKHTICRTERDREKTSDMFCQLIPSLFEPPALLNAFKSLFEQMKALEVETPKAKSLVAGFLSRAVVDDILSIGDVAQVLIGGKHHPLFLLFLQKLEKSAGQAWLSEKFIASKVNLMDMLPEVDRTKERLASALRDRCLGFLDPMLTIEPDLWAQMRDKDPSPGAVYRWIKDNIDQTVQNTPTFAHVFISCLLKYIHSAAAEQSAGGNINNNQHQKDSESSDSSKSSPTNSSSHVTNDQEKELLSRYQQMMHAILKDKQMQLATLYALQLFYHNLNFPKGALLRWFHMLYDLSIVDDDVFFIWKEEINDKIPGKGQALFQVNTWLNWLAEPDSEDDEDA